MLSHSQLAYFGERIIKSPPSFFSSLEIIQVKNISLLINCRRLVKNTSKLKYSFITQIYNIKIRYSHRKHTCEAHFDIFKLLGSGLKINLKILSLYMNIEPRAIKKCKNPMTMILCICSQRVTFLYSFLNSICIQK